MSHPKILVTGASGQLGRLVIDGLLAKLPAERIVALVRKADAGAPLAAKGVAVRLGDYEDQASLETAFAGIDRLLLISSNALGRRLAQHGKAIAAAKAVGVKLVVYTSVLHADRSALGLAEEHRGTERLLAQSELAHILLRNGWYSENYTAAIPAALAHGALLGAAGDGRIASAPRQDYADAAVAVLTDPAPVPGRIHELAGDTAYSLTELAAEISRQAGKPVPYVDLPSADYRAALEKAGLPAEIAALLADSDAAAAQGALFDDGHQLSALIGRPTGPIGRSVEIALA